MLKKKRIPYYANIVLLFANYFIYLKKNINFLYFKKITIIEMNNTLQYLSLLDYGVIGIYILLMVFIGTSFGWFVKDTDAYFKANGNVPWIMAGITSFFSLFSTFVFVAYAGIAYKDGLVAIVVFWATVPACIIGGSVFAKRWKRSGHITPMQYVEERYGFHVQQIITWVTLVMRFLDNMIRIYAIGLFIVVVIPIPLEWAIIISGVIYTLFNIIGGLWSIIVMSIVQFIILACITMILLYLSLNEVGGFSGLFEKIPQQMSWLNGEKGNLTWLVIFYIMTFFNYNQKWIFIQKFYCVNNEKDAVKVGVLAGILFLIFIPVFLLPAVASKAIIPNIPDPEMSYILLSKVLLPTGLMGILFISMFASTMSTLNGEFNTMASVLTTNVYKKIFNAKATEKQLLIVARFFVLLIGTIVTIGGIYIKYLGGAFEANKLFTSILAIPIGVPFLLGLFFKKPSSLAAVVVILVGIFSGVILNVIPNISWEFATISEFLICIIAYFLSDFVYKYQSIDKKEVDKLFQTLSTPISAPTKPIASHQYKKAMTNLFIFSLITSGGLFIGISLFHIHSLGGLLGLIAGIVCLFGSFCWWIINRKSRKKNK